jgi:AcrR family transcriptional regulator
MPKIVDATAQRREIRQAARRIFARRGVAGTGLAHVARAAGMGRSSLYHYYPDKDSLIRDLARELLDEEEALFKTLLRSEASPRERIERLSRALVALFDEWAAVGRVLLDLRLRDAPRFRPFFHRIRRELAEVISEGQQSGELDPHLDPTLTAATLVGAVDGLLVQHFVDPGAFPDLDALGDALLRTLQRGILP